MSFWSSLGQTFFIAFSAEIRADLGLSHGAFGSYYALATTLSALTLFWLGKLADTISVPRLSVLSLAEYVWLPCIFFCQSVMMLIIGYIFCACPAGMMYHVYSTAVTRRYWSSRACTGYFSFGMNAAEALFPIVVVLGEPF